MPNWAENELTITGPNVQKVLETIRSDAAEREDARILDFNRIIPYPEEYRALDQRAHEYEQKLNAITTDDPERQAKLEALGAEYGVEPGTPWLKDGYNSGGMTGAASLGVRNGMRPALRSTHVPILPSLTFPKPPRVPSARRPTILKA